MKINYNGAINKMSSGEKNSIFNSAFCLGILKNLERKLSATTGFLKTVTVEVKQVKRVFSFPKIVEMSGRLLYQVIFFFGIVLD